MVVPTSFFLSPPIPFRVPKGCQSGDSACGKGSSLTQRRVEFATTMEVNILERASEEERATSWYSSRDYAIFGKDVKKTVKHIRKGRSFTGLTGRGLEKYFSARYHEEKKQRELSHYRSILGEQQRQRSEGSFNPKMLRVLSTINSKWALENALTLARHDECQASRSDDEQLTCNGTIADACSVESALSDSSAKVSSSGMERPSQIIAGASVDGQKR